MILLGVKVLLAPSFVVGASLVARRFGARVGGLIAGLPVVAGPILLAYALAHGRAFAAHAAAGTLLGLISLTAIAGWLGPQLSGLLAPFPIIASVLATFTHTQRGVDETLRMLRGLLSGFVAFALFCFTLALALPSIATAGAFALATAVALAAQSVMLRQALRKPGLVAAGSGSANR